MVKWYEAKPDFNELNTEEEIVERTNSDLSELEENVNSWNNSVDISKRYGFSVGVETYDENNSFLSSSGMTYKLYDQTQWPWSWLKYSDGKTMRMKWCMLTSAAVIASSLWNFQITPKVVFDFDRWKFRHSLVSSSVPVISGGKLNSRKASSNEEVLSELKKWNPAVIKVKWAKQRGASKFTSGQHYMALLDISPDGSKVFVWNSHVLDGGKYSSSGWYSTSEVFTSVDERTVFSNGA